MDLTPDELRKVTFKGTTLAKGYSMVEVDEFVEKVAAGIGELLDQLRNATERAARAEASVAESRTSDEAGQRTPVHPQQPPGAQGPVPAGLRPGTLASTVPPVAADGTVASSPFAASASPATSRLTPSIPTC